MKKEERQQQEECLRDMIKSCLTYGYGLNNHYISDFSNKLGKKRVLEICKKEEKYFNKNYSIIENMYTDVDGCTYNTLVKKNS